MSPVNKTRAKPLVNLFRPLGRTTDCSMVTTIPQLTGTCWFNALLMALLYSERTRQFVYNHLIAYDNHLEFAKTPADYQKKLAKQKIVDMFLDILVRHYTKGKKTLKELPTPEYMLQELHRADPKTFYFDPNKRVGHIGQKYLIQVMKYFELNERVLYCIYPDSLVKRKGADGIYVHIDNIVTRPSLYAGYSRFGNGKFEDNNNKAREMYYGSKYVGKNTWTSSNGVVKQGYLHKPKPLNARSLVFEKDKLDLVMKGVARKAKRNWANIDVIQVKIGEHLKDLKQTWDERYTDGARIWDGELQEEITLGEFTYKVDSMIMGEVKSKSDKGCGHEIAGVTCNGKRYMYSGYQKRNMFGVKKPCSLIPFDWFNQEGDFCLNTPDCKLSGRKLYYERGDGKSDKRMCFNMHQSNRTYLYIKDPEKTKKVPVPVVAVKKKRQKVCPTDMTINLKTGRCIKIPLSVQKKNKINVCPVGKMINPKTGRCIKIVVVKKQKMCPDGKMINPKTGRCIKVPVVVKVCPAGKMVNPNTGRCIKVPTKKEKVCPTGKMINPKTGRCVKIVMKNA